MTTNSQLLDTYRISLAPQEIIDILAKNHAEQQGMMWQTLSDHRKVFNFNRYKLDLDSKNIVVIYDSGSDLVDPKHPVYVKLPFRETLFKGHVKVSDKNQVMLDIPSEIHMREYRGSLRTNFEGEEKFVMIKPHVQGIPPEKLPLLKISLKDISEKGMGLLLTEKQYPFFKQGELIELIKMDTLNLIKPIMGKVVYSALDDKNGPHVPYRAGVQLMNSIPDDLLKKFVTASKPTTAEDLMKSDIFSEEFKEMVSAEMNRSVAKLKNRPSLGKYLQALEVKRSDDDYVEEHIKILTIVCAFFGRTLNWVSDASLEKFIYAAYIHDAPLFQFPNLMKIKNMKEFELMKEFLTPEEQIAFLSAPELAAEIALSDKGAPPDVATMLIAQKEMPDGSGFPRAVNFTKITPMASLFIIAHDFTDEIIRNPDWDVEKWIKRAKVMYKGGHFTKVMEAISATKITMKRPGK